MNSPRPIAHLGLDRIKPIVEKINSRLGLQAAKNQASWYCSSWRGLRSDASTPDDFEVDHPGDYATLNSNQLPRRHRLEFAALRPRRMTALFAGGRVPSPQAGAEADAPVGIETLVLDDVQAG